MMLNLSKEKCGCCDKFINIGQFILECEQCTSIIHAKCYKPSEYKCVDNLWLCPLCSKSHLQRYNPFNALLSNYTNKVHSSGKSYDDESSSDATDTIQNVSNILNTCKSYSKKEINSMISDISSEGNSLFSSYFVNIDGNHTNFDEFSIELHELKHAFSVIGLAETNCNPCHKNLYHLPGYTSFYQDKIQNKKKGTGVAVYVHESLNAIFDHEHSIINEHIEAIFASITNMQKPLKISVVYRPPSGNITKFNDYLGKIVESIPKEQSYTYYG